MRIFYIIVCCGTTKESFVASLVIYFETNSCTDTINIKHGQNLPHSSTFVYNTGQAPAMLLLINYICMIRKVNPDDIYKLFLEQYACGIISPNITIKIVDKTKVPCYTKTRTQHDGEKGASFHETAVVSR